MNELWIPILGVICAVGMPVLLGIIASYMTIKSKHEEKMAMIEKGIVLEEASKAEDSVKAVQAKTPDTEKKPRPPRETEDHLS